MLSHRRQSQAQSEAAASISGASFHDPTPDPTAAASRGFKCTPGIDGTDSSAVFFDDEASEMPSSPTKERTEARMLMVRKFSLSRPDTSVRNSRGSLGTYPGT